ncbi:MAG: Gfo/Idh/MocA family oxidoreductase [Spirochaetia bacterium]
MMNVAVIGSGRAGMIHARNFAQAVPGARLVALCDSVRESAEAGVAELGAGTAVTDYTEILADPSIDAVVIATPTRFHREIVVDAAQAGKHILCEKPMAVEVSECRLMNETVKRAGVKLQLGFMRRFDDSFRFAKERVEGGEIGDVVLVKSLTHGPSKPQPWMLDIAQSNGPLAEVSSHDIDALHWYSGSFVEEVYAIAGNFRTPLAVSEYPDYYDIVALIWRFENGRQGMLDGAQWVEYGYDSRVEILGTKGIIRVGSMSKYSVVTWSGGSSMTPAVESWRHLFADAYRNEDIAFVDAIRNDTKPEVTGQDGLEAVRVVKAGNLSITERRPVKLTEVDG